MPRLARLGWPLPILILVGQAAICQIPGYILGTQAITRDASGAFFTGGTNAGFPVTPGAYQTEHTPAMCRTANNSTKTIPCVTGYVAKYSPSGEMVWATYLGAPIDENDVVQDIALDSAGNVWVAGSAASQKFPITANAYDATYSGHFLAELSPDGSELLYSTFLDSNFAGCRLKFAQHGALYFVGERVIKFDPSAGSVIYQWMYPALIATLDQNDVIYLGGTTNNPDFPTTPGAYSHQSPGAEFYLSELDPAGSLLASAVIGGSGGDNIPGAMVTAMVRDAAGNFYVAGVASADLPLTSDAAQPNPVPLSESYQLGGSPFLMKLSADLSTLLYSTFLSAELLEMKIGTDGKVNALARNFAPFSPEAYQPCYPSGFAYVRLSADQPAIEYSTGTPYSGGYGGSAFDFEASGIVYITTYPPQSPYFTTLDVSGASHPGPVCMAQSVSFYETSVAPGLLVSIFGAGIGPDEPTPLALDASGRVTTQLAGTEVLFDGIPAPILSAATARVDVVVPFGVATSGNTTVSVLRNGDSVGTLTNPLARSSLWLFTPDGTGRGSPAWNQDGTPNSPDHPAKIGDILTFYGTGAGAMTPMPVDGTIPQSPQSALPGFSFPGADLICPVAYAGDAPGLVEGIVQINCVLVEPGFPGIPGITTVGGSPVGGGLLYSFFFPAPENYLIDYQLYVSK